MHLNRGRRSTRILILAASALVTWLVLSSKQKPLIIYNGSQSVPIGFYIINDSRPNRGDLVLVKPWPELSWLIARHDILPPGVPLLKTVAALTDDKVCRDGHAISINGLLAAKILDSDTEGHTLSGWSSCRRLVRGELFLLQPDPRSFDSRYFGPALSCDVMGIARSIYTP
jgi:type IV secretory pathway protease TraF